MTRQQLAPSVPTVDAVLTVVRAIERHPPGSPAAAAFRSALRRIGLEADAAGGLAAVDRLMGDVIDADPDRAEGRQAIIRAAWAELLRGTPRWPAPEVS